MSFLGNLFGYDSRGNDLIGVNQDSRYNCVACGLACSVHTPAMEGNCLRAIFGNRGAEPVTTGASDSENAQSSSLVPQGAESADIGKIDAADKSGSTNCTTCGKQILAASTAVASGMMPRLHEYFCNCMKAAGMEMGKVNRVDEKDGLLLQMRLSCITPDCPNCPKYEERSAMVQELARIKLAGSAETGGEKAAKRAYFEAQARKGSLYMGSNYLIAKDGSVWDCMMWAGGGIADITQFPPNHPDFRVIYRDAVLRKDTVFEERANFPRSSQNQTVSGGVEGAHEGTTADKSESREPDKLNNAPRFAYRDDSSGTTFILRLGTHDVIIGWRGKDGYKDIADIKAAFDALAESSLSSDKVSPGSSTRLFCGKCGFTKNCIAPEHDRGDRVEHCAKCHGPVVKRAELASLSSPPSREHQCVSANDCPLCGNPEIGGMKNV